MMQNISNMWDLILMWQWQRRSSNFQINKYFYVFIFFFSAEWIQTFDRDRSLEVRFLTSFLAVLSVKLIFPGTIA
jgi:hypothetical protein